MNRYLILGLAKTGTTLLFHKIKNALPGRYQAIFEKSDEETFHQLPETVIAKMLIGPNILANFGSWDDFETKVLKQFDKIIYIVRDPRDRLISSLLFAPHQAYKRDQLTEQQVQKFIKKLREKEVAPHSTSLQEIQQFHSNLKTPSYVPEPSPSDTPSPVAHETPPTMDPYLLSLELHDRFPNLHVIKYEDIVDGNLEEIERYLNLELERETEVSKGFSYVKRSGSYGAWKSWFTEQDVEDFRQRPNYVQYMERYGYTDWDLDPHPYISPQSSSQYVLRNYQTYKEKKKQAAAFSELPFIIAGFERSGTTMVSEIFRQHPHLHSGFEVGALLFDTPKAFFKIKPDEYYINLLRGWKIDEDQLRVICDTYSWDVFYQRLREQSPLVENKECKLFDKTPKYMLHLTELLHKHPKMKAIVTTKSPARLFFSWARKAVSLREKYLPEISFEEYTREKLDMYVEHFYHYFEGLNGAYQAHGKDRILTLPYEKLCRNPIITSRQMFDFVGYSFDPEYLQFEQTYNNIHANFVDPVYVDEYLEHLSPQTIKEINERTQKALMYCPPEFFAS